MQPARWRTAATVAIGFVGCLRLGCSGGKRAAVSSEEDSGTHEASTRSGLLRTTALLSLNAEQGAQLCDWTNGVLGGYGRTITCPVTGARATDRDRAYCISGLPSCPALTVGDIEGCTLAQGSDICKYFTATACQHLWMCTLAE